MFDWIEVRISDFYSDAAGDQEYAYVSPEVYEALANTFRREAQAHAEEMRDLRHNTRQGYLDGTVEDIMPIK